MRNDKQPEEGRQTDECGLLDMECRWFLRKGIDDIVEYSCDIGNDHACKVAIGLRNNYVVSDLEMNNLCGLERGHKTDWSVGE